MTQTELSDDDLRAKWRAAGGSFHGPHIETGTMPESKLLPFMRALLAREAVEVPQWVSVDERPPPLNTEVLVAFDRIAIPSTAQLAQCGGLRQWLWPKENDEADGALAVTHWMPLPEHPNVGPDGNFIVDPFAPTKGQL